MEQYFLATQKMEQEVMFPSLLQGIFPQQEGVALAVDGHTDLYECYQLLSYQLLKAIKPVVEKGLASVTDQSQTSTDANIASDKDAGSNLEESLSYHVNGLHRVLTD
ncbi:M1I1A protein, partial [Nyctibius bracteatus]|nr:M1I1A protein [Nyctibius bracteatus]